MLAGECDTTTPGTLEKSSLAPGKRESSGEFPATHQASPQRGNFQEPPATTLHAPLLITPQRNYGNILPRTKRSDDLFGNHGDGSQRGRVLAQLRNHHLQVTHRLIKGPPS